MMSLRIDLPDRSYPIEIGKGLLSDSNRFSWSITYPSVIVTNETIAPLYLETLSAMLDKLNVSHRAIILPDGEAFKSSDSLNTIYDKLIEWKCDRNTMILALGGGVIGDLAGFAAATYQRGIPYVQVPTTLLAQVDSSVGGKTAINHRIGKNMIGAFYQPRLVIADTQTLSTLSDRDYRSGIAEIIKYGLLGDLPFFDWLEAHLPMLMTQDEEAVEFAIYRSCMNKKRIVDADERETGQRALLNLGHTFAHAIETGVGYGEWRHGEAVGAGIVMAADLSKRLGYLNQDDFDRIEKLIKEARLPIRGPKMPADQYIEIMAHDKKVQNGQLRLILLRSIGDAFISSDVTEADIRATINAMTEN